MVRKIIRNEREFKTWFMKNFKSLGYSRIVKDNKSKFPDLLMLKDGKEIGVELETLSSNFLLHKHDIKKVDELVCIKKDIIIDLPTVEVKLLEYKSRIICISATLDQETLNSIDLFVKTGNFRNKSHVIERAIELLQEKEEREKDENKK